MTDILRITTIQSDILWENINENLRHFSRLLKPLKRTTDLIILPEMFTTGFSMNAEALAEDMGGVTMQWLSEHARHTDAMLMGSFIARDGDTFRNRLVAMRSDGTWEYYNKRHLFSPGEENKHYIPGDKLLKINWKGWSICPMICYDLRFPVWSRNTFDYDLLVYIASWPDKRRQHWCDLMKARAIENQSYVVGVNRIGQDGNGLSYQGDTMAIDFSGKVLFHAVNFENVCTISFSKKSLLEYRRILPFLKDGDSFEIKF